MDKTATKRTAPADTDQAKADDQAKPDEQTRDALLNEHLNLVYHVARRMGHKGSGEIEFEELVSAGTMGLIDAIEKFEPERGLAFSTFAVPRIRGAILDELRRLDTVSRTVRRKQRDVDTAREELTGRLGRTPSDEELADELAVDLDTLWRWRREMERAVQVSLDTPAGDDEGGAGSLVDVLIDDEAASPEQILDQREEVEVLQQEIAALDEQERTVLGLYYYEELKLREIAEVLDLTVSRISQIRSKAIKTLRSRLVEYQEAV